MAAVRAKLNWLRAHAPDLAAFEAAAFEAFAELPEQFRGMCGDVVILVDDYPDAEALASVGLENELDLMGLYSGVALPFQEGSAIPRAPNTVHLYRVPILLYWAEHNETLGHLVKHVLIHEIGHHFGLSDAAMHALEEEAEREERS